MESAITLELLPLKIKHSPLGPVRFFDYTVSLTGYQWVVMSVLIAFLLQILRRRWKRADSHLLSKPQTVAFSAWITVMSLGGLFPLLRDGTLTVVMFLCLRRAQTLDAGPSAGRQ